MSTTAPDTHRPPVWREIFDRLSASAAERPLTPAELDELAEAHWWLGRLDDCIAAREHAFEAFLRAGDRRRAALVATDLAKHHFAKQAAAVASGWISRAERILADEPEGPEHGYLERLRAVIAFEGEHDHAAALAHADRALKIGTRYGDPDLMALALQDKGRVLLATGRVVEGNALIDEATAAAVAGELRPITTGILYCNTIMSCEQVADYRRAGEWTEAARRWCERQAIAGFPGLCRVHHAAVLRLRGSWVDAEREARRACEELAEFNRGYAGEAYYEIGRGRLAVGDVRGAEEAFRQAHEFGRSPEPGLSLVRLAEGKIAAATSAIRRALAEELPPLTRVRLLPAQVEIAIAANDLATARAACEELGDIARRYGTEALAALAASSEGLTRLASGDAAGAAEQLRTAFRAWQTVDAPYEAALSRAALGRAYRALGDEDAARMELDAAHAAFERLGAVVDARATTQLLGGAGARGTATRGVTRTFMFTDIVRSTRLAEALGDAAWSDVLRWHDQALRELFAAHGGDEIDHAGDGFFVAFEDVVSAVDCAVAIQRRLTDHQRTQGFAPELRIGLHTAPAARRAAGYKGKGVHEAARIAGLAAGGEIVASLGSVDGQMRYPTSPPRSERVKGIAQPIEVVTIDWR